MTLVVSQKPARRNTSDSYPSGTMHLPTHDVPFQYAANACISDLLHFAALQENLECPGRFAVQLRVRSVEGRG